VLLDLETAGAALELMNGEVSTVSITHGGRCQNLWPPSVWGLGSGVVARTFGSDLQYRYLYFVGFGDCGGWLLVKE
jgi:hypothetical protein